ncbi:MAG: DUF327 family protein [Spirochaeta sp.]|jgi:uncharacterized protein YaaR (DUF327 family)|nr:DUF327 family protein [Spirochaeta sp.]
MEPIRSDRQRGLDRHKRNRTSTSSEGSGIGGFATKLESVNAPEDLDPVVVGTPDLGAIPDISAPAERLYDAVHEAGERLLQERTYTAAQQYRETVRRFLRKVVPEANSVSVHESQRDILSRKRYYLLTTINRSVDRLIHGLLQAQTEQLEILRRLEEIEGMLVDLMQ